MSEINLETSKMKFSVLKLSIFPPTFCNEELIIHRQSFPDVQIGDILEIHHPEQDHDNPRLLLKVGPNSIFPDNHLGKAVNADSVLVEKSIAESFHLQNFKNVNVRKVRIARYSDKYSNEV